MSLKRSDVLAAIQKIRRELDALEHAVREAPAGSSPAPRTTPPPSSPRVNAPRRSAQPRRSSSPRPKARTPQAPANVPCEHCRDFCWVQCPCSCHQAKHAARSVTMT